MERSIIVWLLRVMGCCHQPGKSNLKLIIRINLLFEQNKREASIFIG